MKRIPLTRGLVALVDDEDYPRLAAFRWYANRRPHGIFYATRMIEKKIRYMHHDVIGKASGLHVDHLNGNALDNRKANLRFATPSQNSANRRKSAACTSRYKGVNKEKQKWQARIGVYGKRIFLGLFDHEEDAARAYDRAALLHFGPFARLNFPSPAARGRL